MKLKKVLKTLLKQVGDKVKANVGTGGKMDQWIDKGAKITAKIAEPGSATKAIFREEELDEYETGKMRELPDTSAAGLDNIANAIEKAAAKKAGPMTADAFHSAISKELFGDKAALPAEFGSFEESKELEEAMNTIATLRSELNEVNLLNAKLLYVNKLFKAKNLNESQKVKVINAFDRAETVREAKNVFDTLNESLNTEKAKSQIKESLSFASKSAGVSDRQPIMEGNDFMLRMQKLAGII
jgi:hypothetical protein